MRRLRLTAGTTARAWTQVRTLHCTAACAAATAKRPPQSQQPGSQPRAKPGLLGPSGAPLPPRSAAGKSTGRNEVELTAQNSREILTSPGAFILQVGKLPPILDEKLDLLFEGAEGKLPLVKLDCAKLPQVCQALKIVAGEAVLLLAQGRVIDALEGDAIFATEQAVGFVERVAKALGLQIDLAGDITQQVERAESTETSDPSAAEKVYVEALADAEASSEIRARAMAGRARCALRSGDRGQAELILGELQQHFDMKLPEVKQAQGLLHLFDLRVATNKSIEDLAAAAEANPGDLGDIELYVAALFWQGDVEKALKTALGPIRRRDRSEAPRELVTNLIDALGPRHALYNKARRDFNNLLFI